MGAGVAAEDLLKELAALWAREGSEGEAGGVLRACTMTLVVVSEEGDDESALGETLAALMPEHPARTILVRLQGESGGAVAGRVYQQCWMPFGQRRQICCEQIEITAGAGALDSLPPLILPLTLPDLPLILWCRSPRLMARAEFAGMARMAAKLVIDSGTAVNGVEVLQCLASAAAGGEIVADLAWTRLTRWRETLARIFENRDMLARLAEAESVRVGFGPGLETSACYLAAWMAGALESVGRSLEPRLTRQEESLALELAGGGLRVQLTRHGDRLVTVVNGQSGCAHLPRPTAYLLMREELAIARHDPVFEKTLARAARLAVSSMPEQL